MAAAIKTTTVLVMVFAAVVFAEDYDVGDDNGWRIPDDPDFYSNWASRITFRVGDVLEFEFPNGAHDVAIVTKESYDSCNKVNPISLIESSPAEVTLNKTGAHYFICTIGGHCTAGQKLSLNVVGATGSGAAPAPGSDATPATMVPTTPSGTITPPPPQSAASSLGGAGFLVAFISFAVALMSWRVWA